MTTTHTAHDVAVRLFAQLEQAWNASDGAAFGSVFAGETDFVDARGSHHCGDGVAVGAGHQALFDTLYAGTAIAYRIETGYPDTQLDMVYFLPALQRSDGRGIGALSTQGISGASWQRWSRHREPGFPWRPGVDDLSAHLLLVDHWLEREVAQ